MFYAHNFNVLECIVCIFEMFYAHNFNVLEYTVGICDMLYAHNFNVLEYIVCIFDGTAAMRVSNVFALLDSIQPHNKWSTRFCELKVVSNLTATSLLSGTTARRQHAVHFVYHAQV